VTPRPLVVLALVLCRIGAGHAAPPCFTTDACLRVIENSQRSTRVLVARFEQTKSLSLLAEPLVSRGRFAFRQPDQVFWSVDDPPVTVRIDRRGVRLPDLADAGDAKAALGPLSTMLQELSGLFTGRLGTLRQTFTVSATADAALLRLHLVPQPVEWQRMFRVIDVSFALPDAVIHSMRLEEALGDSLEITFSDVHRNDAVASQAVAAVFDATPAAHE